MKLSKERLKQIIKEELEAVLSEEETLEEGVAYLKGDKVDPKYNTFMDAHKKGEAHLVRLSYTQDQEPIAVIHPAGTNFKEQLSTDLAYAIVRDLSNSRRIMGTEKQIKAAANIDDAKLILTIFKL